MSQRRRPISIILAAASLLALPALGGIAVAETAGPREVGRMPVVVPSSLSPESLEVTLLVNPRTKRAYQVYREGTESHVSAFDLSAPARPRHVATLTIPGNLMGDGPHLVDERGGRLFLPNIEPGTQALEGIVVIDEARFRPGDAGAFRVLAPPSPIYSVLQLRGFRYEPSTDALLMQFDNVAQSTLEAFGEGAYAPTGALVYFSPLAQWNATSGAEDWLFPRACPSAQIGGSPQRQFQSETGGPWVTPFLSRDGRAVNVFCVAGSDNSQFVRLELDEEGQPTNETHVVSGPSFIRRLIVDPISQRTHVVVFDGYSVTFDWIAGRTVGTTALSAASYGHRTSVGLDPRSGRWYAFVSPAETDAEGRPVNDPGGLLLIDGRRTPVPQALAAPNVTGEMFERGSRINVYPVPGGSRYIFLRPMVNDQAAIPYYRIIEDAVPVSEDPPAGELDRTIDIAEVAGRTERSYEGQTTSYGWRSLFVGGGATSPGRNALLIGPCSDANRELVGASIRSASLSNIIASARAFPDEADPGTREDFGDFARCWPTAYGVAAPDFLSEMGPGWGSRSAFVQGELEPVGVAECTADGEGDGVDPRFEGAEARTACHQREERIEASADYPLARLGPLTIGRAHTDSRIYRDARWGITIESLAFTEGIQIAGVASIEAVRSEAFARANGRKPRPGDPDRTKWQVLLCGVRTSGFTQQGCENPDAAISALNEAGRGRVLFVRPAPDQELLKGSPGGYVAGIQRDEGEAQLAQTEHNDQHPAVPGLEIHIRNDDQDGAKRTIVQLAAVQAVGSYGISFIPAGGGFDDIPRPGDILPPNVVPPVPPVVAPPPPNAPGPIDDIVRVVKRGFDVFWRAAVDALVSAGIWTIFATPVYLVVRRRRLRFAR